MLLLRSMWPRPWKKRPNRSNPRSPALDNAAKGKAGGLEIVAAQSPNDKGAPLDRKGRAATFVDSETKASVFRRAEDLVPRPDRGRTVRSTTRSLSGDEARVGDLGCCFGADPVQHVVLFAVAEALLLLADSAVGGFSGLHVKLGPRGIR